MKKIIKNVMLIFIFLVCAITVTGCANDGKSAYDLAVEQGFDGDINEWLDSLKAPATDNEFTIEKLYEAAQNDGYTGTLIEFIAKYFEQDSIELSGINNSLLSVVSIIASFKKDEVTYNFPRGTTVTEKEYAAAGSGVIYNLDKENGNAYIITNFHVVYDNDSKTTNKISDSLYLFLYGMEYEKYKIEATYVGGSMTNDIAILKVSNSNILRNSLATKANIADSNDIIVGQNVYAVGNPEAEGIAITTGIVSVDSESITMTAVDKATSITIRVIRIDAAVNSGNSGGGLFNSYGQLIGIVNAKVVDDEIENIGYAIPITKAVYVADNIIRNCDNKTAVKGTRCVLGITGEIDSSYVVYKQVTNTVAIEEVIKIYEISSDSVVKGLLEVGDIINSITIKGVTYDITRMHILTDILYTADVNEVISVTYTRNSITQTINVTLSNSIEII